MKLIKNKKGFTLIELIVVIAIIGILAAIAIPSIGGFRNTAEKAADEQTAEVISRAIAILVADGTIKDITADGTTITYDGDVFKEGDNNAYDDDIQALVVDLELKHYSTIDFKIDADGAVTPKFNE